MPSRTSLTACAGTSGSHSQWLAGGRRDQAGKAHARTSAPDHRYYAAVKDRKNSKRACLSEARKILRQAHHILAELGDDALAVA